jgi:hypothetical protein
MALRATVGQLTMAPQKLPADAFLGAFNALFDYVDPALTIPFLL